MAGHVKKRKRPDGTVQGWQVQIPTGGGKRYVRTFERKQDAARHLIEKQAELNAGTFRDPRLAERPFRELVETWERTRAARLAPKTRERYSSVTRVYLLPAFGSTPLGKLTRADIKEWFAALTAEGCSPGTARKIQVVLSSILSEGVELGLLRENPAARLGLPSPERRDMTILTAGEVRALAEAMPAHYREAVYVAAYTGLRAGELWALRVRDVDLAARTLRVERTLTSENGRLIFRNETKTDGSRRVVSLPTFLANMLANALPPTDALLFTSPEGGPVRHPLFMSRVFKPAVRASLPHKPALRWHDLRHTCASLLIDSGASILLVQKRLGHANPTTTMRDYGHLYPSAEAALADALDAIYTADDEPTPLRAVVGE